MGSSVKKKKKSLDVGEYMAYLEECPAFGSVFDETVPECIACRLEAPSLYKLCRAVYDGRVDLPSEVLDFSFGGADSKVADSGLNLEPQGLPDTVTSSVTCLGDYSDKEAETDSSTPEVDDLGFNLEPQSVSDAVTSTVTREKSSNIVEELSDIESIGDLPAFEDADLGELYEAQGLLDAVTSTITWSEDASFEDVDLGSFYVPQGFSVAVTSSVTCPFLMGMLPNIVKGLSEGEEEFLRDVSALYKKGTRLYDLVVALYRTGLTRQGMKQYCTTDFMGKLRRLLDTGKYGLLMKVVYESGRKVLFYQIVKA